MRIKKDLRTGLNRIRNRGVSAIPDLVYGAYKAYLCRIANVVKSDGTPVLDRDWDVLIVLDATRLDMMEEVAPEYPFIDDVDSMRSLGANSREWMKKNFEQTSESELRDIAYVTANPLTEDALDTTRFGTVDEVWRYGWDSDVGTVPARPVTDRAIKTHRESRFDRMIVHYMQPHIPFIDWEHSEKIDIDAVGTAEANRADDTWEKLRRGYLSKEEVMAAYKQNLRYVLDELDLLLENLDAERVVISADHGNAVGEFGIYGHPKGNPLSCIRNVPWCVTTAEDHETYSPEFDKGEMEGNVEERLESLGYR